MTDTTNMDDAELKRVAEAATPGPWEIGDDDFLVTRAALDRSTAALADLRYFHMPDNVANATYIATFDPPTVLGLLARLSAAEARVGVLEEALQVQRGYVWMWTGDVDCGVSPTIASLQGAKYSIDAALTQEPTP